MLLSQSSSEVGAFFAFRPTKHLLSLFILTHLTTREGILLLLNDELLSLDVSKVLERSLLERILILADFRLWTS